VPKKRTSTPMEMQPVSGPRPDDAILDRRLPRSRIGRAVRHSPPARKPMPKPLGEGLSEISEARWRQSERAKTGDGPAAVFSAGPAPFLATLESRAMSAI